MKLRAAIALAAVLVTSCGRQEPVAANAPTPEPQIVYVVVTPTRVPIDQIPASQIAEFSVTKAVVVLSRRP